MSALTPEHDVLAGELALRVLAPAEEAAARARETAEPAFAEAVERWNTEVAALAEEVAPVEPSDLVWPRVKAEAFAESDRDRGPAANDNTRAAYWRGWGTGGLVGIMLATIPAVFLLYSAGKDVRRAQTPPAAAAAPAITRVATIQLETGATVLTLAYDQATGVLYVAPAEGMAGDGRVPHLWLMKPDGGVQLVGALGATPETHRLPSGLMPVAGSATAVAISMEAPGHTPAADKPDGPVVGSGELRAL